MKILNRYLLREILHFFSLFISVLLVVMLIAKIFDTRELFAESDPAVADVVLFLIYALPKQIMQALPLTGLLATMFAYGLMAKNREILAMVAAGISLRTLVWPAVFFGTGLALLTFVVNDQIVPTCETRARYLEKVRIKGRSESILTQRDDIFVKGLGGRFYYMDAYHAEDYMMIFPTVMVLNERGSSLIERVEATRAEMVRDDGRLSNIWAFHDAERWIFDEHGDLLRYRRHEGPYRMVVEQQLERFLVKTKTYEEMSLIELTEHLRLLRRRKGENILRFAIAQQHKLMFPLTSLLMAVFGFACVADVHARRFTWGLTLGLAVGTAYFIFLAFMMNVGRKDLIDPYVAAWSPFALFSLVLVWFFARLQRVG